MASFSGKCFSSGTDGGAFTQNTQKKITSTETFAAYAQNLPKRPILNRSKTVHLLDAFLT